jgi:hypothetical protein
MIIGMMFVVMMCNTANANESKQFKSETKKLNFIKQMLKKEKHLRLGEDSAPHCKKMMKDLLKGKNFKAIEPYLRADSEDSPRLSRWKQCEDKDYQDVGVDSDKFFERLSGLGGPPYRFYRIELDGNRKNGLEDMVYHEIPSDTYVRGDNGYTWVDLKKCMIKPGFPVETQVSKKNNAVFLTTLVYFKNTLWAVDYNKGFSIDMMRRIDLTKIETCQWWLFDPKTADEEP